jgi:hypothetical protein
MLRRELRVEVALPGRKFCSIIGSRLKAEHSSIWKAFEMSELDEWVDATLRHVAATIGEPSNWCNWPGGWPGDIEAALVDAIYSARATYDGAAGKGVGARVVTWRATRTRSTYSLTQLISEIDSVGISDWAKAFGNQQHSPGRRDSAEGGSLKAAAIKEAAQSLLSQGIDVAADVFLTDPKHVWKSLQTVSGVGYATANYFLMLLGAPGVKPDRMIHRFLTDATGLTFTNPDAERVLLAAAERLKVAPHDLDHAIWSYESKRARRSNDPEL